MKTIVAFLFAFLLILSGSGNATEKGTIDLVSFDNSSSVVENYKIEAETISEPKLEQKRSALPESISMFFLGAGLVSLGTFARKKVSRM